jgi:hypothetical protein
MAMVVNMVLIFPGWSSVALSYCLSSCALDCVAGVTDVASDSTHRAASRCEQNKHRYKKNRTEFFGDK